MNNKFHRQNSSENKSAGGEGPTGDTQAQLTSKLENLAIQVIAKTNITGQLFGLIISIYDIIYTIL